MKVVSLTFSVLIFQRNIFFIYTFKCMSDAITFAVNDSCKPAMQARKSCWSSEQQLGWFGQLGGGVQLFSKKVHNRH
jgi:hypothetical protein